MNELLHEMLLRSAGRNPDATALRCKGQGLSYSDLARTVETAASGLVRAGLSRHGRVAVYLPKRWETVAALFAASRAGGVTVPINPQLRPRQVEHILKDASASMLITHLDRAAQLAPLLTTCPALRLLVLVDDAATELPGIETTTWAALLAAGAAGGGHRCIDADLAALLYTSGSTGQPKGVMLSHRNLVTGARSVARYLDNSADDRLLAVLPLSFDYGFSQLTTAFHVGASAVLMDYLLPLEVLRTLEQESITGLAAVPPLWIQLAQLPWPEGAVRSLRYITNSGGAMPGSILATLRRALPATRVFLMYGLTEAFRSTYLPPTELERRPDSIGKAIPDAEVLVLNPDGNPCAPGETGELVHRGSLVALGYWNAPEKTLERFKPLPQTLPGMAVPEMAVWSGDLVRADEEGFLYYVGRRDEMIKTSGYRVSPTEIEEVVYALPQIREAAALGVPHPLLGQAIILAAVPQSGAALNVDEITLACRRELPAYMVPLAVEIMCTDLPRNANGKIDRVSLSSQFHDRFIGQTQPESPAA